MMLLVHQVKKKIANVEGALNGTRNYLGITEPVSVDRAQGGGGGGGLPSIALHIFRGREKQRHCIQHTRRA